MKEKSFVWLKRKQMVIEHLQVRNMERQRKLFEQQIEELHSCKMKVQEQKRAEGEEEEEVFKWGLQLKRERNNYEQIKEKLDGLLKKKKELAHRNKEMESEKNEEELRKKKQYNEEKLKK